jgi:hypothetical protein
VLTADTMTTISLPDLTTPSFRLRVTVWAKQSEILHSIVGTSPVNMIKLKRKWLAQPLTTSTAVTPILKKTTSNEPSLQAVESNVVTILYHDFLKRAGGCLRSLLVSAMRENNAVPLSILFQCVRCASGKPETQPRQDFSLTRRPLASATEHIFIFPIYFIRHGLIVMV